MQENLRLRVPALEWSVLEGRGELSGLTWVDSNIDVEQESFSVREHSHFPVVQQNILPDVSYQESIRQRHGFQGELRIAGQVQFKHRSYERYLPKIMTTSAQDAQIRGEPTVLEGMHLLYARVEWLMKARPYFWSSLSPVKDLMAILAESYGISPALHNSDRDVLARVIARMPSYYPRRGKVKEAISLWKETLEKPLDIEIAHSDMNGAYPTNPDLRDEVFICHRSEWWSNRLPKGVRESIKEEQKRKRSSSDDADDSQSSNPVLFPMNMRIENGVLRFQLDDIHHQVPVVKEDILIKTSSEKEIPSDFFQLLPNWTSVRLVLDD